MVDAGEDYVPQDKAEEFASKYWGDKIRGTPKVVKVLATEPPMSLYPALKVQNGCQILHITQAIATVSINFFMVKGFLKSLSPTYFTICC